VLPCLTLLGVAGLLANVLLSFERPHAELLFVSALLLLAAPLGLAVHLGSTPELTSEEKRMWLRSLCSGKAPALFAAYLDPAERRRATQRLVAGKPSPSQSAGGSAR